MPWFDQASGSWKNSENALRQQNPVLQARVLGAAAPAGILVNGSVALDILHDCKRSGTSIIQVFLRLSGVQVNGGLTVSFAYMKVANIIFARTTFHKDYIFALCVALGLPREPYPWL